MSFDSTARYTANLDMRHLSRARGISVCAVNDNMSAYLMTHHRRDVLQSDVARPSQPLRTVIVYPSRELQRSKMGLTARIGLRVLEEPARCSRILIRSDSRQNGHTPVHDSNSFRQTAAVQLSARG